MLRKFEVFLGDIADAGCDVLVNSSNTRLGLGTGVSRRIYELCGGDQYQVEIRNRLQERWPDPDDDSTGRLPHGEAILTDAGNASSCFQGVVHVAAVDYENDIENRDMPAVDATSVMIIEKCAENLLREVQIMASNKGVDGISVATPLMGSSSGKLSAPSSAEAICNGIRKFFTDYLKQNQEQSVINRVVIVAYNKECYSAAYGAMRRSRLIVE